MGTRLGALLNGGDFIALSGDLGAGKTHFAKGIATGLGVDPAVPITSPTYTLLNIYSGRIPFYHFDLYRLHGDQDILDLGFEEYFYGNGVCVVEWAERLRELLPPEHLMVTMAHAGENSRIFTLTPSGKRAWEIAHLLAAPGSEKMF